MMESEEFDLAERKRLLHSNNEKSHLFVSCLMDVVILTIEHQHICNTGLLELLRQAVGSCLNVSVRLPVSRALCKGVLTSLSLNQIS